MELLESVEKGISFPTLPVMCCFLGHKAPSQCSPAQSGMEGFQHSVWICQQTSLEKNGMWEVTVGIY